MYSVIYYYRSINGYLDYLECPWYSLVFIWTYLFIPWILYYLLKKKQCFYRQNEKPVSGSP